MQQRVTTTKQKIWRKSNQHTSRGAGKKHCAALRKLEWNRLRYDKQKTTNVIQIDREKIRNGIDIQCFTEQSKTMFFSFFPPKLV